MRIILLLLLSLNLAAQSYCPFDNLTDNPDPNGTWTVSPNFAPLPTTYDACIDDNLFICGIYYYTYTVQSTGDCLDCYDSTTDTVLICNLFAQIDPISDFCSGDIVDASVSANACVQPYTYDWSNGQSTSVFQITELATPTTDLDVTYTVTVTDANGCTRSDEVMFTIESAPTVTSITLADANCGLDGEVCFDFVNHGTRTGIEFSLDGGSTYEGTVGDATGQVCYPLPSGTYNFWVRWGNNECPTDLGMHTINDSGGLVLSAAITNETCTNNGSSDGAIDLTVSGGTPSYTYMWSNSATTEDLTNISSGSYSVTVEDVNGCTSVGFYTVGDDDNCCVLFTTAHVIVGETCGSDNTMDGSIDITTINNATPPLTFNWNNGATTNPATNLNDGIYSVTITDSNGCTTLKSFLVPDLNQCCNEGVTFNEQFGSPSQSCNTSTYFNWIDLDCTCCTGTFTITYNEQVEYPVGSNTIIYTGVGIETENCSTALDPNVPTNICSLTPNVNYEVTIEITNVTSSDPDCDTDHLIGLTYSRTDFVTQNFYNICGCNPCNGFNVTGVVTDETCNSQNTNDGAVNISVSGGSTPYSYSWSNSASSQDINSLSAGNYTVTVTDNSGCSEIRTYTVNDDNNCADPCAGFSTTIFDNNCTLISSTFGGTTPYSYFWSTGQSSQQITANQNGTYSVTVTDAIGCTATDNLVVSCAPVSCNSVPTILVNGCNLTANVTNCPSPSITWFYSANGSGYTSVGTGATYTATLDGFYLIQVTGCPNCGLLVSSPVNLNCQACNISVFIQENPSCTLNAIVGNAIGSISYAWSNSMTSSSINVTSDGTYSVTVTDSANCTAVANYNVSGCTPVNCDCDVSLMVDDVTCPEELIWSTSGDCSNYSGQLQYSSTGVGWNILLSLLPNTSGTYNLASGGFGNGIYRIVYFDGSGSCSSIIESVNIAEVGCCDPFNVTFSGDNTNSCGDLQFSASGGTSPYTWSSSTTGTLTESIDNTGFINSHNEGTSDLSTPSGTYVVTATDANGCTSSTSVSYDKCDLYDDSFWTINSWTNQASTCPELKFTVIFNGAIVPCDPFPEFLNITIGGIPVSGVDILSYSTGTTNGSCSAIFPVFGFYNLAAGVTMQYNPSLVGFDVPVTYDYYLDGNYISTESFLIDEYPSCP